MRVIRAARCRGLGFKLAADSREQIRAVGRWPWTWTMGCAAGTACSAFQLRTELVGAEEPGFRRWFLGTVANHATLDPELQNDSRRLQRLRWRGGWVP